MRQEELGRANHAPDAAGSKDPTNVDVFRGAAGGIVNRATLGLMGEADPEVGRCLSPSFRIGRLTVNDPVDLLADP